MVVLTASVFVLLGSLLALWAMACNCYFIGIIPNRTERGHQVVQSGPFRYGRYPDYLGSFYFIAFTLLMFGSLVGLILAVLACGEVFACTYLEDQTLQAEFPRYQEYASAVTGKLLTGNG